MALKSGSRKKTECDCNQEADDKDRLIDDLKGRIAALEDEIRTGRNRSSANSFANRRAEEALRESEEKFRMVTDFTHDWECWTGPRHNFLYVSPSCERITGHVPDEFYRDPGLMVRLIHPDDRAIYQRHMDTHYSNFSKDSGSDSIDFRIVTAGGETIWINHVCLPVFGNDGKWLGRRASNRDITQRKLAEEALRESEEKYRFLVENSKDLIWKIDPRGRWTFVSSNVEQVTGFRPEEILGKTIWDFLAPECHKPIAEKIRRRLCGEDIPRYVTWIINKAGERIALEVTTTSIVDKDGTIVGVQGISRDITLRMRTEEALRLSEERYRNLVENVNDIVWQIDENNVFTYISKRIFDVWGYMPEEVVGKTPMDFMPPDEARRVSEDLKKTVAKRDKLYMFGNKQIRKDGGIVYLEVSGQPILDKNGICHGYRGTARDITERKEAEEALKAAYTYNRSLIEASLDPLITISPDGTITDVNRATELVTGIDRDGLVGTDFTGYFTDPDMARKGYLKVFEEGQVKDYPLELRHRDGHITQVLYNASVYRNASGDIIGVFAAARDISERKRVEEALRESEDKFRVLAETSPAAIFLYQGEKYVYVNPMAETLTGYTRDELLAGETWDWIHPESRDQVKDRSRKRQRGEKLPVQYEVQYRARDGREGWVDFTAGLIEYRGRPAGLAMAFDVTKRKQAEEELKETKAQAELYVDLMGHDINNMNQVSLGFLELARNIIEMDGKLGEDNVNLLDRAMDSMKNSSQLIDSVRKIQREKMGLYQPQVMDVSAVIAEAVDHFNLIPGRDVKIRYDPYKHDLVKANSLLKDVFINLIGNAIKHSRGDLEVNIRMGRVAESGKKYCRVEVEDNGPGIPDNLKATLFDRLSLTATRAKGKGFGLCLIKMLVDDYRGKFWVEDRVPGDHTRGAKFVVMLPAVDG